MKKTNKILLGLFRSFAPQLFFLLLLMLIATGFQVIVPWPFKLLIDNVLGDELLDSTSLVGKLFSIFQSKEMLGIVVVFLLFFFNILSSVFEYFTSNSSAVLMKKIVYRFSEKAFSNLEGFNYMYYRNKDIGDYIYRLSYDVSALSEFLENGVFPITTSIFFLIITTIVLFRIDVVLALLSLTIVPVLSASLWVLNKMIVRTSKHSETSNSLLFTYVQQALSQLKIIQAFSQEQIELNKYNKKMESSLNYEYKVYRLNFLLTLTMGIIVAIGYSLIIGLGINQIFIGQMSAGLLIVFIFYLDNLTEPVMSVLYATSELKQSYIRISRLSEFFNPRYHTEDTGTLTEITNSTLTFDKVTLNGDHGEPILHNMSFTFEENKINALIGMSGSGKTSIVGLMLRLIDQPNTGEIRLGEHRLKEYSLEALRRAIAYVPQEAVLFNQTIGDIIAFGNPHATLADIRKAAKLADADSFIERHPGKYDFKVGDQGNLLSGGQRQRLMLARAYVKDARIMILDEVFASQDPQTRQKIIHTLREYGKGRTVILVTNIIDILDESDTMVVIDRGRVIKTGIYKNLKTDPQVMKLIAEEEKKGGE